MPSVTRREFLKSLKPRWLTVRLVKRMVVGTLASWLLFEIYDYTRSHDLASTTRTCGFLAAVCVAVFAIRKLADLIRQFISTASDEFRSFASKLSHALEFVAALSLGAYLYAQWNAGTNILPSLIVIALTLLADLFRDDQRANKTLEPTATAGTDRAAHAPRQP